MAPRSDGSLLVSCVRTVAASRVDPMGHNGGVGHVDDFDDDVEPEGKLNEPVERLPWRRTIVF